MKIIDKKTGGRVGVDSKEIAKKLKKDDPLQRDVYKQDELGENSPMDPPDAYDEDSTSVDGIKYEDLTTSLKDMIEEHKEVAGYAEKFEKALGDFHESSYHFTQEINDRFNEFFKYFDDHILPHNRKEERHLFPALHRKLIESGEHSPGAKMETAVDLMEDDHVKFIQLASLTFNLLGLASRLPDNHSRAITFDLAYHNGKELIELLRLHIFREDNTIFPLTQKLFTEEEIENLNKEIHSFNE